jgi:hypothetical protein
MVMLTYSSAPEHGTEFEIEFEAEFEMEVGSWHS